MADEIKFYRYKKASLKYMEKFNMIHSCKLQTFAAFNVWQIIIQEKLQTQLNMICHKHFTHMTVWSLGHFLEKFCLKNY